MAGSGTEAKILKQQESSGDGNRFPGRGRTLVKQEPPRESAQVNRQDQGGGGGNRSQIHDKNPNAQNVGPSNIHNAQGQEEGPGGGYKIWSNTITASEGASHVGIQNFGNNTRDWKCWIL